MGCETKHLFVVESTCTDVSKKLESTYSSAKDKYAPDVVTKVLETVESYAKPVVNFGQNTAFKTLMFADNTVDKGVHIASSAATHSRKKVGEVVGDDRLKGLDDITSKASKAYQDSKDVVKDQGIFAAINKGLNNVLIHIQDYSRNAKQYVGNANGNVKEQLDSAYSNVYNKWLTPAVNNAANVYTWAHDQIVRQPLYATLYDYTTAAYSHLSSWKVIRFPFEVSHEYLYPVVKPVVGPFVDRFGPYGKDVKAHLQPQAKPANVEKEVKQTADATKQKAKKATGEAEKQAKQKMQDVNLDPNNLQNNLPNGGGNGKSATSKAKEVLPNSQ